MFDSKFIERFEKKFQKSEGCWEWLASSAGRGYGQIKLPQQRRQAYAHRVAYEIYKGPIPSGLQVLHSCDNPKCVNPDHLFAGTSKENLQDMRAKNRSTHGEKSGTAKLTAVEVLQIRQCLAMGMTQMRIAAAFGVSQIQISRIKTGQRWERIK